MKTKSIQEKAAELKVEIINKLREYLQVNIPAHSSARFAILIPPKGSKVITRGREKPQRIEAVLLDYVVIRNYSGRRKWICYDNMTIESLISILKIFDNEKVKFDKSGKYLRAINPFWFIESDVN